MREIRYCDDCPILELCRDKGETCEYTRWIQKQVDAAPPISPETARKIATLLWG